MNSKIWLTLILAVVASFNLPLSEANSQVRKRQNRTGRSAKADLKIMAFEQTADARINAGKIEVPFSMTVKNIGNAASKDNVVNGIRISNQYRWSGFMNSLAPNESKVVTSVLKTAPPAGNVGRPNRELHLIAMTDAPIAAADTSLPSWGRERESDERNNTKALGVAMPSNIGGLTAPGTGNAGAKGSGSLARRPSPKGGVGGGGAGAVDLVVEQFERVGQVRYRDGKIEVPFRLQVRNQGALPAPANLINGISFANEYRWSGLMDSIQAGGLEVITGTIKIPDAQKLKKGRKLRLIAMADAPIAAADTSIPRWGRVQESNEANNKRVLNVNVPGELDLTSDPGQNSGSKNLLRKRRQRQR